MTDSRTPRPHRPEPIGWGTVDSLTGRAQTIAKGWLLLLLERAPLDSVGTFPAAALAAEGPALCAAVVRALGSDAELARLAADGDLAGLAQRVGPLCGARDAAATVAAVEALRACVWVAALETRVGAPDADAVGRLADRLAAVTAVVTATALAGAAVAAAAVPQAVAPPAVSAPPASASAGHAPPSAEPAWDPAAAAPPAPSAAPAPPAAAPAAHPLVPPAPEPAWAQDGASAPEAAASPAWDHDGAPGSDGAAAAQQQQQVWSHPEPALDELRDDAEPHASVTQLSQRQPADGRQPPAMPMDDSDLWIATLERHIDRCQREGGGLALLRVELVDGDRVAASAPDGQAHVPYGRLAQAVRRAIRRQDLVASDHHGRAWVIAPGVGRAGAIALAERIGEGVEGGEQWRGAPLAATIGYAVYGEDGRDAATLIDRAEEAMLAATAAGARIGEAQPHPEGEGSDPDRPGPRLVR